MHNLARHHLNNILPFPEGPQAITLKSDPCHPTLLDVCLQVPLPGVLGPDSLSCDLGFPSKGLPGGAYIWFSECVASPYPSSTLDHFFHWLLAHYLPEIIVADDIWPVDCQDPSQVAVDECLYFCHCFLGCPPRL